MKKIKFAFSIIVFSILSSATYADTIDIQLTFDPQKVILSKEMGYDFIDYPGTIQSGILGKPSLPTTAVNVSLPYDSTVNSVTVIGTPTIQVISGDFFIYPTQPPKYIGDYNTEADFTLPDPSVYNVDQFYPSLPYSNPNLKIFVGSSMASVEVHPFRYNPVVRVLDIYTSITLRINYTPPSQPPSPQRYMEDSNRKLIITQVKAMVTNPDDVEDNYEPVNIFSLSDSPPNGYTLTAPNPLDTTSLPSARTYPYTYVIITNDRYRGYSPTPETDGIPSKCTPLANWRTELGLPATMRTVEWIAANYWTSPDEYDLQDAIRSFIHDARDNWGTLWFILIGDVNQHLLYPQLPGHKYSIGYTGIVPARYLCAEDVTDPNTPNPNNYCPCDLYYMNVTDNFNGDGDQYYGEPHELVSPYDFSFAIDLFGARVPADAETEVETFINKLLHYEKLDFPLPPANTYLSRCLQVGADFGNKDLSDIQTLNYLPNFRFQNILEGFIDNPAPDARFPDYPEPWQVVQAMNNPAGIINFATHGSAGGYYILTHKNKWPPHCQYIQFLSATHEYPNYYVHCWNFDKALEDVSVGNKYSFLYSESCQLHRYDEGLNGVSGEESLFNPSWGGPIAVGNVRSSPADAGRAFLFYFYNLLTKNTTDYGDDDYYSGSVQCQTLSYGWAQFFDDYPPTLNYSFLKQTYMNQLFGCPRTSIWRGDPQIFTVSTQKIHNPDNTYTLKVIVKNKDLQPITGAVVCLWMKNNIPPKYYVDTTDSNGEVNFNVGAGCLNATLTISYEQFNYKPYQTLITVP